MLLLLKSIIFKRLIYDFSGNYASSTSPTSPFYSDSKLSSSGAFSPSRAHLPSFIGGFFGKDSISVPGSNQASLYERLLQQAHQKAEQEGVDEEVAKVNGEEKDEPPAKRSKEDADNSKQTVQSFEENAEKVNADKANNESGTERKNSTSDSRNENSAMPLTMRPHHLDEADIASFTESPLSASSLPSPSMTSLSPTLPARADGAHHVTLKGSASFLHIPVATAEL